MRSKIHLLIVSFLISCIPYDVSIAQVFRHFSQKEGAPEEGVLSIVQDKKGFLWYATTNGLYRYDSRTFKKFSYKEDDTTTISSNLVESLFCDSDGVIWAGTRNGLNRYNSSRNTFTRFKHNPKEAGSISGDTVYCIAEDSQKKLWVGTSQGLNSLAYVDQKVEFTSYAQTKRIKETKQINKIAIGDNNQLWLATVNGLLCMDPNNQRIEMFRADANAHFPFINNFKSIYYDKTGSIWLGIKEGGLLRYHLSSKKFELKGNFLDSNGEWPIVSGFASDKQGKMWISTWSGLVNYDRNTNKTQWYTRDLGNPLSLVDNVILTMYKDTQDGIWLGCYYRGISYLNVRISPFSKYPFYLNSSHSGKLLDGWMGITPKDNLWIIAEDRRKMMIYDKQTEKTSVHNLNLGFSQHSNHFYVDANHNIWYSGNKSLSKYNINNKQFKDFKIPNTLELPPNSSRVYRMIEDKKEKLWIAGGFGLLSFDKNKETFHDFGIKDYMICIFQDSKGNIWSGGKGIVWLLKTGASHFQKVEIESKDNPGKSDIWRITEDTSGRIWLITSEKLKLYDEEHHRITVYPTGADALPEDLSDIQADRKGYLWLSSGSNLIRYHPDNGTTRLFTYEDGLPYHATLRLSSAVSDGDGLFYVPGNNAYFSFNPNKVMVEYYTSPIVLTSLRLFNKEVNIGDHTNILNQDISEQSELIFRHDQNIFTLDFSMLSYNKSDQNRYSYKLEGFEKNWNNVEIPTATYTNLPAGKYTFLVKAVNGDGYWSENPLRVSIVILAPWWHTWYAYLLYALVFIIITYVIVRFFWFRSTLKKESELQLQKLTFFTNVSHEIRTHLSLINGPLEKASRSPLINSDTGIFIAQAKSSSDRLMYLVDELLDFRKLESGHVQLQVAPHDMTNILRKVLESFKHVLLEKEISLNTDFPEGPVIVWVDQHQIQKVYYNLLNNAVKFTPKGGRIDLGVTEISSEVCIKVTNTGTGIAPEYLSRIFTNFFQIDENQGENTGYGIGLAIAKEVVDQHCGDLSVTSQYRKYGDSGITSFTMRLLKGKNHFNDSQISVAPIVSQNEINGKSHIDDHIELVGKKTLLIIEDNTELRTFTKEAFKDKYNILEAEDGVRGLDMTKAHLPDLILCDVMMPVMDGLELCRQIKADARISHIPILLLTAKSGIPNIIEGLEMGADDYLVKPYDLAVLELKVSNLIKVRSLLRDNNSSYLEPGDLPLNDVDGEFILKLKNLTIDNLANPKFGVNEIALQSGISVSVLYKKLKVLTGMTVNDFVKVLRMKRAMQLLETGLHNVNEVATAVGYNDTKYFSREFKKIYGKNPNEIRKSSIDNIVDYPPYSE
ncbi:hybrid sensor histidine kinase/response regulator transcription factor [Dyadobacter tibetensis]|uniref:hybrid sensor histidine kinase/response regulator transcription factor n=1 Tax=Dyadobacter tibetensis TaxID=1211851 RepID=UPI00046F587B|nr:hybrid sensor histidine kinase/response regulator transcription factor [Dyadobacter tibetensis]